MENNSNFPKVSIIIVNWNGKEDTLKCIESVLQTDYPNYNIIVVDNASTDDSVKYLKEKYPEIIYLENKENLGWTGGNNTGMEYAIKNGADYCFLLNNDIILDKNCLKELIRIAKSNKRIGFVVPKVYYHDNPKKIYSAGLNMIYPLLLPKKLKKGKMDRGQFDNVYDGYGCPNDFLIELNIRNMRVKDIEMSPVYGKEKSGIRIGRFSFRLSWLLLRGFFRRINAKYGGLHFHPLWLFYMGGIVLSLFGLFFSGLVVYFRIFHGSISPNTVLLTVLLLIMGFQSILFGMFFDMETNKELVGRIE